MTVTAPLIRSYSLPVGALGATTSATPAIARAPFAGVVSAVRYAPVANITGADSNTRTLTLVNKCQDGNGTTSVASLPLVSGTNLTDYNETDLTLSGTPANLVVAEGDILAWSSVYTASGLADPGGLVTIEITRS
mgnify:CR=1 FL=1